MKKDVVVYTLGLTGRQQHWIDVMFRKQGMTAMHAPRMTELSEMVCEAKPDFVLAAGPEFTEGAVREALNDESIAVKSMRFPRFDRDVFDDDDPEPWNKRPI